MKIVLSVVLVLFALSGCSLTEMKVNTEEIQTLMNDINKLQVKMAEAKIISENTAKFKEEIAEFKKQCTAKNINISSLESEYNSIDTSGLDMKNESVNYKIETKGLTASMAKELKKTKIELETKLEHYKPILRKVQLYKQLKSKCSGK